MHTPSSASNRIDRRAAGFVGRAVPARKVARPAWWAQPTLLHCLIGILLAAPAAACDFCLPLPRVPFEFDHPAAIEVALATQAAAELGELDLNPGVKLAVSAHGYRTTLLSEISPRQLIARWVQTRPAASIPSLRCSMEVVFVDVDFARPIDIRFGEILDGNRDDGPADVRLMTTKAGFCRLLEDGLEACEQRQLVAIEAARSVNREELERLFAAEAKGVLESRALAPRL